MHLCFVQIVPTIKIIVFGLNHKIQQEYWFATSVEKVGLGKD